ncbi:MAG: HEAT repeat domain-containing protein [Deltaproteobacteria bacterium]|nr:HEAT repeat domain-containing protein [Deltaproteobacteria bacterium]
MGKMEIACGKPTEAVVGKSEEDAPGEERMDTKKHTGRAVKQMVLDILKSDDFDQKEDELRRLPGRQVINPLFSFLCHSDQKVKWRAVTAMGVVVSNLAKKDMESARIIMRRLMWSLNDESGGIGWGAPETMAESMACHQGLAKEYVHILVSYIWEEGNFLEYEMLQRGALWGIGRLAESWPHLMPSGDICRYLPPFIESKDATVRGLAARAMGLLGTEADIAQLEPLLGDNAEIEIYLNRKLVVRRVSDLAREALSPNC